MTDQSFQDMPATEAGPLIRARDLRVRYPNPSLLAGWRGARGYEAIKGLDFTFAQGTRVGLLGRNGSGKSTLLRTLAGVFPPSGGELEIRGARTAIFSATSGFNPEATGRENIALRGVLMGLSYEQIQALSPGIIEFSELGEWIDRPLYSYSSGMTLRLAFSIVTSVRKDILLMDEWIGAGDAAFLEKAKARMDAMVAASQIIVLASHNLPLVLRVCERALVIEDGVLHFDGPVEEGVDLYRSYRDGKASPVIQ